MFSSRGDFRLIRAGADIQSSINCNGANEEVDIGSGGESKQLVLNF